MPEVHLSVSVIDDGVLYNLTDIKWDVLNDGKIEQSPFRRHLANVHRRDEMRGDKMVSRIRYIGQMFGLEVHGVALVVQFPLTLPICEQPKDLRIIRVLVKPIKGLRGDRLKIVIVVDRLRTELYQHPTDADLFEHIGRWVGVEFSHKHRDHRSWGLAQCTPTLPRNGLRKKIVGMLKSLLLNEGAIGRDEAELLNRALIDKFTVIVGLRRFVTGPASL